MPPSNDVASTMILPMLEAQQRQLDSIVGQMQRMTQLMTQMAVIEEKNTQDRRRLDRLEDASSRAQEKLEKRISDLEDEKETQAKLNVQYNEMLGSYNKFKSLVITTLGGGLLAAAIAFSSGLVKIGA